MTFHTWSRSWAYPLLAIGMLAACGGSSSNKSPSEKCIDLADELCKRLIQCNPGLAGMQAACEEAEEPDFHCSMVTSVSASYSTCMAQLDTISCTALFQTDTNGDPVLAPPDSCLDVLISPSEVTHRPVARDFAELASMLTTERH